MPTVVISEFMDQRSIDETLRGLDVRYDPQLADRPGDLAAVLADARVLVVRNRTQVRSALLDAAPKLELIGRLGVGLDNIDVEACRRRGIAVCPSTGANNVSVAEYVVACLLLLLRPLHRATADVASGLWPRAGLIGREAAGKRLGLVGFGGTARETAARAATLGMTIAAYDPHLSTGDPAWRAGPRPVAVTPLAELLASSDVVSLHVPLVAETRNILDAASIAQMKRGAILINAARGGLVDERATVAALRAGALGGAAFDVFRDEPLSAADGAMFADCPNLLLTPHIAGVTVESNVRVSRMIAEAVRRHLGGS